MNNIIMLLITLLVIIIHLSCNSLPKGFERVQGEKPHSSKISEECNELLSFIKEKWAVNDNCYYFEEKGLNLLNNKLTCFNGWNVKEIINLFGEPNIKNKVISYNIAKKCDETLRSRTHTLYFYYQNAEANFPDRIISGLSLEKIR